MIPDNTRKNLNGQEMSRHIQKENVGKSRKNCGKTSMEEATDLISKLQLVISWLLNLTDICIFSPTKEKKKTSTQIAILRKVPISHLIKSISKFFYCSPPPHTHSFFSRKTLWDVFFSLLDILFKTFVFVNPQN